MSEFENQYKVCMELIKQKSREVSETDIFERLVAKAHWGGTKGRGIEKKRRCLCFNFTHLQICNPSLFWQLTINNINVKYY